MFRCRSDHVFSNVGYIYFGSLAVRPIYSAVGKVFFVIFFRVVDLPIRTRFYVSGTVNGPSCNDSGLEVSFRVEFRAIGSWGRVFGLPLSIEGKGIDRQDNVVYRFSERTTYVNRNRRFCRVASFPGTAVLGCEQPAWVHLPPQSQRPRSNGRHSGGARLRGLVVCAVSFRVL